MRSGSKSSTASKPAAAAAASLSSSVPLRQTVAIDRRTQNRFPNWSMPTIVEHTPSSTIAPPMIASR